jgi:hypothetical protein
VELDVVDDDAAVDAELEAAAALLLVEVLVGGVVNEVELAGLK